MSGSDLVHPLPPPLSDDCAAAFEEEVYTRAFLTLNNSIHLSSTGRVSAFIPPPHFLAYAATLAVHPHFTAKTALPDRHAAADDALRYLQHLGKAVDPHTAGFRNAFRFAKARGRSSYLDRIGAADAAETRQREINSSYAKNQSLWSNANDFWALLGWAFNASCSTSQHVVARWMRWQQLLDLLLDLFDRDLEASSVQAPHGDVLHSDTLISHALVGIDHRRAMRAIFADGSPRALGEFGEVWKGESAPPQRREKRKRRRSTIDWDFDGDTKSHSNDLEGVDVDPVPGRRSDEEQNADADASSDEIIVRAPSSPRTRSPSTLTLSDSLQLLGGIDSIHLRQKVLSILVRLSEVSPNVFLDTHELFALFAEFFRPLPLNVFEKFVLPLPAYLGPDQQLFMAMMLFRPLTPIARRTAMYLGPISQQDFENHYAILTATTSSAVDNAKVSLLVESMLRYLWPKLAHGSYKRLSSAVFTGTNKRESKISSNARHNQIRLHNEAMQVLKSSAGRMKIMVDSIKPASPFSSPKKVRRR